MKPELFRRERKMVKKSGPPVERWDEEVVDEQVEVYWYCNVYGSYCVLMTPDDGPDYAACKELHSGHWAVDA